MTEDFPDPVGASIRRTPPDFAVSTATNQPDFMHQKFLY